MGFRKRRCSGFAVTLSLLFFFSTAPAEKRLSQTAIHLSSPSSFNDPRQVETTLLKMSRNLHPNLIFPTIELKKKLDGANGELSKLDSDFWSAFHELEKEWKRITQPSEGWTNQKYPELKQTDGQGTVLSITADLMLEHPALLGLGTGGLGVLKRDDTFAFGEALGNENYFLVAPLYSQWSHQEVTKEGEQKWIFHAITKEKLPLEDLGVIHIPYGFDEPIGDKASLAKKVADGEIPPTSRYIAVKVWKAKMGKGNLLLLDTDIDENEKKERYIHLEKAEAHFNYLKQFGFKYDSRHDRDIMERIYPKDKPGEDSQRQRFKQYVVLSLGAFKAFALANKERGIKIPSVLHLNDPHVAPAAAKIYADPKYKEVLTIYTNHTLVAGAGTQWFHPDKRLRNQKANKWFHPIFFLPFINKFPELANIFGKGEALDVEFSNAAETIVATKLPYGRVNAVNSDEHAVKLAQQKPELYGGNYKGNLVGVDNGVDIYWGRLFPFLWENLSPSQLIEKAKQWIKAITAQDIEKEKRKAKQQLVDSISTRYKNWLDEHFDGKNPIDPTKMVMVFAKRFNAYKRPDMVLNVSDQIREALRNSPDTEVIQIIFSGKANDNDDTGKKLVRDIVAAQQEYKGEIRYSDGDKLFKELVSLKNKYQQYLYYPSDKEFLQELTTFTDEYLNQSEGNNPEKLFKNLLSLIEKLSDKNYATPEKQELFRQLKELSHKYRNRMRVLYLPDYHIEVSQKLLPAADFWLNTPQRHQEASGTSLLKALINAAILISTQSGAALHEAFFKNGKNALLVDVGSELYEIPLGHERAQEVEDEEKKQLAALVVHAHDLYYRPEQRDNLGRMRLACMEELHEVSSFRQVEDQMVKTVMPLLFRRDFKKEVVDIEASATGAFEVKVDLGKFPPQNAEVVVHYQDASVANGPWKNAELKRFRPVEGKEGQYLFKFKGQPPFERGNVKYVIRLKYKENPEVPSSLYNPEFNRDPWVNAIRLEEKFFFKPGHEVKPAGYGACNEITIYHIPEDIDSSLSLATSI